MIIYSGTKARFMEQVDDDSIADELRQTIFEKMHRWTPEAEYQSWNNSLNYMYRVLNSGAIPDNSGVAIEYNVPNTAKRVDFLLSGYDAAGDPSVVVVELKQWSEVERVPGYDALVNTYVGGAKRNVVRPSYQAWTYATMIRDYNEYAQKKRVGIYPCAYLHNYRRKATNDPIDDASYQEYLDEAPVFSSGEGTKLRAFMENYVVFGDDCELLFEIDHGRIKPSKSLQDAISGMLAGNREFNLIDDQILVLAGISKAVRPTPWMRLL